MIWYHPDTLMRFTRFVVMGFVQNKGLENAKSLTYTSLFAVVPLITLVFAILSAFPTFQVFATQIQDVIFTRLLPSSSLELETYLSEFASQAKNLTWVGAMMLFVTAYLMLVNIERNFNLIWGVEELRKGLSSFLLYWSVLSLGPLLLGLGFAISSYVTSLTLFERFSQVSGLIGAQGLLLRLFPIVLTTGAFTLLYVAVPNCGVKVRHGLIGALVVSLSFILVKGLFTQFIATASYALVYGTFAVVPIFLLWLYICWVVILLGANLVRSIPLFVARHAMEGAHPSLVLLALMHRFWEKQQHGEPLSVQELADEGWPLKAVSAKELLAVLGKLHLVRPMAEDEYLLVRDLSGVTLWEVLKSTPWAMPDADDLERPLPVVLRPHLPDMDRLRSTFARLENVAREEFSANFTSWFRDPGWWPDREPAVSERRVG